MIWPDNQRPPRLWRVFGVNGVGEVLDGVDGRVRIWRECSGRTESTKKYKKLKFGFCFNLNFEADHPQSLSSHFWDYSKSNNTVIEFFTFSVTKFDRTLKTVLSARFWTHHLSLRFHVSKHQKILIIIKSGPTYWVLPVDGDVSAVSEGLLRSAAHSFSSVLTFAPSVAGVVRPLKILQKVSSQKQLTFWIKFRQCKIVETIIMMLIF